MSTPKTAQTRDLAACLAANKELDCAQRHYIGGRIRHPPLPGNAGRIEADGTGVRQTDDISSAVGVDAERHSRRDYGTIDEASIWKFLHELTEMRWQMKVIATAIADVKIIEPRVFGDQRGFFTESWNAETFMAHGINAHFVQDNHSRSSRGVLRGLHYQQPEPQGKLVRVTAGAVFDVVVDLRKSAPSFGRWVGVELSAENFRMLWIPPGMAHGFLCLADGTDFMYKCTAPYRPEQEHCLLWNDPVVAIEWPLSGIEPQLSAKDLMGQPLDKATLFS